MRRRYNCAKCGWKGHKKRDPVKCPRCGGATQRIVTAWDGVLSDLARVAAFLLAFGFVICVWTWLSYPFSMGYQPSHDVRLGVTPAGIGDTPQGPVARFQLANDSIHQFAQVRLKVAVYVYKHGHADPVQRALPEQSITITDLGPRTAQRFDVPIGARHSGDLFGWNATLESFDLPPGYWNKRLQSGLSVRLAGLHPNVPAPFEGTASPGPMMNLGR